MNELFSAHSLERLNNQFSVIWGKNEPIPTDVYNDALASANVIIASAPTITRDTLSLAPNLHTVIEVSGAFPDSIDYQACWERSIEVLSCSPGFKQSVAEFGLAMAIASARGVITQHEHFRVNNEQWLEDNAKTDFSLYQCDIGFVGFGQIAQELTRLLAPFNASIKAFDPWLSPSVAQQFGVRLCDFDTLLDYSRCLFVTASPTSENYHLLSSSALARLQDNALVVLLSRAHLVDFDAMQNELQAGRLRFATDVFPSEPLDASSPLRRADNVLLSPHRAAAVSGGRQLIGDMIVTDLIAKLNGSAQRHLAIAKPETIDSLAGIGDAEQVADMAGNRAADK